MSILYWVRVVVLTAGLVSGVSAIVLAAEDPLAAAESPSSAERHARLEVRVDRLEADVRAIGELQLDRRLTRLETLTESNRTILLLIGAAVVAQLAERVFRVIGGRKATANGRG